MPAIVNKVENDSIAEELQIEAGDEVLSIDENKMTDLIDYNFFCKTELLTLEIKKKNGEIEIIEIEKDFDEDLGIIFESAVFDKIKPCHNKCIFCFVDQQPKGLRETLYIKDDDYRLSYLQGTYVTLTNLGQKDKDRIEKLGLGPFYISVHTTNPELRVKMLRNPKAGEILTNLKWLESLFIPVHLQIVLCPGFNDGSELKRTLNDIKGLKNVLSVAIVPLGLTKFRKEKLAPVTPQIAAETISIVDDFNKSIKKHLVCCSDEFFALADAKIPPKKYYGDFLQLDDGVGALRLLLDDFNKNKKTLPESLSAPLNIVFATSKLAIPAIKEVASSIKKIKNLQVEVIPIQSTYWGENISVAGLITSEDLIKAINTTIDGKNYLKTNTTIIIPSVMLRPFSQDFLDGKTLDYVKQSTGADFLVITNYYSTKEIVDFIESKAIQQ